MVLRTEPTIELVGPTGGKPSDLAAATARNRTIIEASTLADWTPRVRTGLDGDGPGTPLLGCDEVSTPPEFAGLGVSSVLTVNLRGTLADPAAVGVLAGSDLRVRLPLHPLPHQHPVGDVAADGPSRGSHPDRPPRLRHDARHALRLRDAQGGG